MFKLILFFTFLVISNSFAEPAPYGLIYKDKSCADFWGGDECTIYQVPDGWKELYPNSKCNPKESALICYHLNKKICKGDAKTCCEKFGFEFVKIKQEPTHNQTLKFCNKNK